MTIQSIWNRTPSAAVTHTAALSTRQDGTAAELYQQMHKATLAEWRTQNPGTSHGQMVVLHWSFTPNALT